MQIRESFLFPLAMKRVLEGSLSTRQISISPYSGKKFVVSSDDFTRLFQ